VPAAVEIRVVDEIEQAVRGADVLIIATLAREPIVGGQWLKPGQYVTAIGADGATKCDLDALALRPARVIGDDRQAALAYGDVHRAIGQGGYEAAAIAGEIGYGLAGRSRADEITIAKPVSLGVQDLAAAQVAVETLSAERPHRRRREPPAQGLQGSRLVKVD